MRNTNKKGFTIVELVVVIAVIAVLAAVLIPTFSGIIKKANLSADQKAARDMNTVLATEFASEAPTEIKEVIDALDEAGFNVNSLTPVSKDHKFYWNVGTREIILADATDKVIYPKDGKLQDEKENLADGASFINVEVSTPSDAVAALESGSDITLKSDITLPNKVINIENNDITIDLNGYKLSGADINSRPLAVYGDSTVTINSGDADAVCGTYGLIDIKDGANVDVVINGGNYIGDLDNGAFIKVRKNAVVNITLNNVTYVDAHEKYTAKPSYIVVPDPKVEATINLTINGGSYTGSYGFVSINNITINNATIKTDGVAILANKATVTNCDITIGNVVDNATPTAAVAVYGGGEVKVSNCKITSSGMPAYAVYFNGTVIAENNTVTGVTGDAVYSYYAEGDGASDKVLIKIDGTEVFKKN